MASEAILGPKTSLLILL